ncbi:MAG: rhodanese-like domain-containing protein [Clostridium sp.]|nr:rhodanese-like domain-containing protein [Clostridium sp.]
MRFHNINIRNILSEALNYGGIIVDVRSSSEFAKGHIPMAINLPLEDIQGKRYSLPKTKVLILYCENSGKSSLGAKLLAERGFSVINAIGGLKEYKGPLTKPSKEA